MCPVQSMETPHGYPSHVVGAALGWEMTMGSPGLLEPPQGPSKWSRGKTVRCLVVSDSL